MHVVAGIDWGRVFGSQTPLLEIFLRGTLTYLILWALLRFSFKREVGGFGITNLLVIVLIADAAQNAMAGEYRSITDGVFLVVTIVGWSFALDWAAFRFPGLRRVILPPPLPLVKDGRFLRRNMRTEMITADELQAHLRMHGIERVEEVKEAHMESDGRISVIRRDGGDTDAAGGDRQHLAA
jgi:uncharacterized membrane protein YcaP (DUF421 family)